MTGLLCNLNARYIFSTQLFSIIVPLESKLKMKKIYECFYVLHEKRKTLRRIVSIPNIIRMYIVRIDSRLYIEYTVVIIYLAITLVSDYTMTNSLISYVLVHTY